MLEQELWYGYGQRTQVDIQTKIAVDLQVSSCLIIAMNQVKTHEKTLEPSLKSQNEYRKIGSITTHRLQQPHI